MGDGFVKTFKYTCLNFKQVTTNVTNQESDKVMCHIWLPFPPNWWPSTRTTRVKIKLNKMAHLSTRTTKDDNKNEKTTNGKINPSCCTYFLNSWELMYVEDGKVVLYITHFLGYIFHQTLKVITLFFLHT
jgi:hypothetical protein